MDKTMDLKKIGGKGKETGKEDSNGDKVMGLKKMGGRGRRLEDKKLMGTKQWT